MTKKNWLMLAAAVALAALYVIFFTNWFRSSTVGVFHTDRTARIRGRGSSAALPGFIFGLDRSLKLTDIKVVPLNEWQTNKNVLPVWHLVAGTNNAPIKNFSYGVSPQGMVPAVAGTHPEPLATNVTYRLFIEAGNVKGVHDFELK